MIQKKLLISTLTLCVQCSTPISLSVEMSTNLAYNKNSCRCNIDEIEKNILKNILGTKA